MLCMMRFLSLSLLCVLLSGPQLAGQPSHPGRQARADSVDLLKQLAPQVWIGVGGQQLNRPARLIAGDELTRAALDSFLVSRGTPFLPALAKGEGTTCPSGFSGPQTETAYVVSLKVYELKDSTAKAGFVLSCGRGEAPGTAFATGAHFNLRRVNGQWILGELIGGFIS